jgi:hypothetical protein
MNESANKIINIPDPQYSTGVGILGSLVIRVCAHFFTFPEDPVTVRAIKPQRAQRIIDSCYFSLLPHICLSMVFRNLISKVS